MCWDSRAFFIRMRSTLDFCHCHRLSGCGCLLRHSPPQYLFAPSVGPPTFCTGLIPDQGVTEAGGHPMSPGFLPASSLSPACNFFFAVPPPINEFCPFSSRPNSVLMGTDFFLFSLEQTWIKKIVSRVERGQDGQRQVFGQKNLFCVIGCFSFCKNDLNIKMQNVHF